MQTPNSKLQTPKLVGIGGLPRSGKDTLAGLFLKNGWFGINFGDVVREESRKRHANDPDPISVANMTETGNWLRGIKGPDFILKMALEQFEKVKNEYKGLVAWAIRAPVEADYILKHGGQLIWVEACDEVRYARNMAKLRDGEPVITLAEFKRQEDLQWQPQPGVPENNQMNIRYVQAHATLTIKNNGNDINEFLDRAKQLISGL